MGTVARQWLDRYASQLVIAACILLAYSNIYQNGFVFDDQLLIVKNAMLRSWDLSAILNSTPTVGWGWNASSFYRPVQIILYTAMFQSFGLSPVAFHVLHVVLHIGCAWTLFALGCRLGFNRHGVLVAVLLWALHPIQTEAVTYMSSTPDLLYSLFCLLGCWVLAAGFTPMRMVLAGVCFVMALLSKETAVTFPLLVCCCVFLGPQRSAVRTYFKTWPLWVMLAGYVALRACYTEMGQFYPQHAKEAAVRVFTMFSTLPEYLGMLVWPSGLHIERNMLLHEQVTDIPVLVGIVIAMAMLWAVVRALGGKGVALGFGILWFACAHALHTGLVWLRIFEHWMYLPTAGLLLGVVEAVVRTGARRAVSERTVGVALGLCFSAIVVLGVNTYAQNRVWQNAETLFKQILTYNRLSLVGQNGLGLAYMERGLTDKAIAHFDSALLLDTNFVPAIYNRALAIYRSDNPWTRTEEMIAGFKRAIELKPEAFYPYGFLAEIYKHEKNREQANYYWGEYLKRRPAVLPEIEAQ